MLAVALALGTTLSACLNQVSKRSPKKTSVQIDLTSFNALAPSVAVGAVVRTQASASASVDLIGWQVTPEGSRPNAGKNLGDEGFDDTLEDLSDSAKAAEALGGFCAPESGSNDPGCNCVIRTDVEKAYNPTYYEADLVRCPIPEELLGGNFSIYLKRNDRSVRSNLLLVTLGGNLSTTDAISYADVQRYACRWEPFVSHMMDPSMIDPLQSKTNAAADLVSYSTNRGNALARFAALAPDAQQFVQCPPHIDPNTTSLALELVHLNGTKQDLSDASGAVPEGATDHVNFLVAKAAVAPFLTPILISQAPGVAPDVALGFAALPDRNQQCDNLGTIPAGMRWRKLWLFRKEPGRHYSFSVNKLKAFAVACQPRASASQPNNQAGRYPDASPTTGYLGGAAIPANALVPNDYSFYPDCGRNSGDNGTQTGLAKDAVNIGLSCPAGRYITTGMSRILLPTSTNLSNPQFHRCVNVPSSTADHWLDQCADSPFSCSVNQPFDSYFLCLQAGSNQLQSVFSGDDVTRTEHMIPAEYLFIVTEPNETLDDMEDWIVEKAGATGGAGNQYRLATDPNGTAPQYPLCVLQRSGS